MRYIRFDFHGEARYGVVEGNRVRALTGDPFGAHAIETESVLLTDVRLLAPVTPPNIIAIGLNYKDHARESNMALPDRPVIFFKATTSLNDPGAPIVLPAVAPDEVDYECELAVVIGRRAKDVTEEEALDFVFGYTCGNDVSARDCQIRLDRQWARGKSFDTFCPIGPWIVTDLDTSRLSVCTRVNGVTMQRSNTEQLIFDVRSLVSYCSRSMTLLPGTVILTGTPGGVGFARTPPVFLRPGDVVEVEIEGIGTLRNPVA